MEAPRVTLDQVNAAIVGETYTVLPDGRTTVCQLTLDNGFTVMGTSACVSKENFDAELGNKYSRERALSEVWRVLGFRLQEHLAQMAKREAAKQAGLDINLGDRVYYYEQDASTRSAPMAATVTAFNADGTLSLCVFAPNGTTHARTLVQFLDPGAPIPADLRFYAMLPQT